METSSVIHSTTARRPSTTAVSSARNQPAVAQTNPFSGSPSMGPASGLATVDVDDPDDGSSIDERMTTYTASLTSSVVDYPTEYGRRYHAFRQGGELLKTTLFSVSTNSRGTLLAYQFPNDDQELDRLDLTHKMMLKTLSGKLYLAPLQKDKVRRILDIGTGTGIWAVEMGDCFPNAEIIGNDLSPIQTPWVPPNVKFEIDDVESSWVGVEKYDYIFCRYMVVAIADWPKLIQNIYEHLNPGGWVEFQEMDGLYYSEDNTYTEELAVFKWNREYLAACDAMGRTARPGSQVEGWVRGTGFDNVESQKFKTPIGPWAKDPQLRDVGMICLSQLLDGLEGFTLKLFCGFLGKTQEEVLVMLSHVRKELKSGAAHILVNQHVVYAQKPSVEAKDTIA
ncbi:hypothetical protein GQ607_017442 [Colletotrichum asianum]|uniref:Methyltransferase domain-containing protein n=1 Tax=Colletotrichum asianum TaxID=702518 RepID=A0A8H3VUQ3_9PEZI|nr:hypothetical protein GQ607_017442 [Colletotrichum asianum]